MLDPLVTGSSIDLSPLHVLAVVVVAMVIGLIGVGIRRFLVESAFELGDLWRGGSERLAAFVLRHRRLPESPWFCERCRSCNSAVASRCYACSATRAEAEAAVPDAEAPAGAGAGRSQRTRRQG